MYVFYKGWEFSHFHHYFLITLGKYLIYNCFPSDVL